MNDMLMLDGLPLSIADVLSVATGRRRVGLKDAARSAMSQSRGVVEDACSGDTPRYGINTGFGSLSKKRVPHDELAQLQRNLVRSHAAGLGPHLSVPIVRGMMLIQAASLARGVSGIRPEVVDKILALLNSGITPAVPEVGSVGASGDLAPLAAAALTLMGEGEAYRRGALCRADDALAEAGIESVTLQAKEGLALINGTHLMASRAALLCDEFERLFSAAIAACGMSIDATMATDAFLDARVHKVRNQPGQADVAAALREMLRGSQIIPSHRDDDPRVQDPYSFRCAPPVLGAALDAARYVKRAVEQELGGVTDNPLVFEGGDIISAGNFHGMPLAIPLDTLAIALSHIAGISERRTFAMLAAADPASGLVPYLASKPGVQSGLMIVQYTAAACCNEIIGLANPASVANISTSAGIEDYNSFGPRAAAKAERALSLTRSVVAIELLCAAQGIDLHRPLRSGDRVERLYTAIRERVPTLVDDRPQTPDIEALTALLDSEDIGVVLPPPLL
ncbi:MAG: histidine ammonia-lyase [Planctomycetota bacterium]|nr:histidine ammonia-lyase [Planctomycetota bacterium]